MQGVTTSLTSGVAQFCDDCAANLRSYYDDCFDGVGVDSVDLGKPIS